MSAQQRTHAQIQDRGAEESDSSRFRPIGIPAVNAAARQINEGRRADKRAEPDSRETPAILRDHHDND